MRRRLWRPACVRHRHRESAIHAGRNRVCEYGNRQPHLWRCWRLWCLCKKKKKWIVFVFHPCILFFFWCLSDSFLDEILILCLICLLSDFAASILDLHSRCYGWPRRAHSFRRRLIRCAMRSRPDFFSLFVINEASKKVILFMFCVVKVLVCDYAVSIAISIRCQSTSELFSLISNNRLWCLLGLTTCDMALHCCFSFFLSVSCFFFRYFTRRQTSTHKTKGYSRCRRQSSFDRRFVRRCQWNPSPKHVFYGAGCLQTVKSVSGAWPCTSLFPGFRC